jgi:hypothetical protein
MIVSKGALDGAAVPVVAEEVAAAVGAAMGVGEAMEDEAARAVATAAMGVWVERAAAQEEGAAGPASAAVASLRGAPAGCKLRAAGWHQT